VTKSNSISPLTRAIERFNEADLALLLAVSANTHKEIYESSKKFETARRGLLETLPADPADPADRRAFASFIGERFLLSENCARPMKREALDKLVQLAAR